MVVVGKLVPHEEVQELENKYEEGVSRIRTARGWCNAGGLVAIGAGAGAEAFTQTGTVVNIRVTPGADGAAPGIKVKLASGVQEYYEFSDVVPYVHEVDGPEDGLGGPVGEYEWEEGGLNGNPNTATERLVDGKGRGMLTYSVRRPASAAAASGSRRKGAMEEQGFEGPPVAQLADRSSQQARPASAAPRAAGGAASQHAGSSHTTAV